MLLGFHQLLASFVIMTAQTTEIPAVTLGDMVEVVLKNGHTREGIICSDPKGRTSRSRNSSWPYSWGDSSQSQ